MAALLLIAALPFLIVLSLIITIQFKFKQFPIFVQERGITLNRNRFKIFKFRTLAIVEATNSKQSISDNIFIKNHLLKKVTPFSAWLRKTGIDEIPQLLNIVFGQMSFIGPRPLMLSDLQFLKQNYPKQYSEREKLNSKPGISGMWQIFGDRTQGVANLINLDSIYDKNRSFFLDIKLSFETFLLVFSGEASDAILYESNILNSQRYMHKIFSLSIKFEHEFKPLQKSNKIETGKVNFKIEIPHNWWCITNTYKQPKSSKAFLKIINFNKNKLSA